MVGACKGLVLQGRPMYTLRQAGLESMQVANRKPILQVVGCASLLRVCWSLSEGLNAWMRDEHHPGTLARRKSKCRITRTTENDECSDQRLTQTRVQRDEIHPDVVTCSSLIKSHSQSLSDLGEMRRNDVVLRFPRNSVVQGSRFAWHRVDSAGEVKHCTLWARAGGRTRTTH